MFCFSIFARRNFLICDSDLSSYPGFDFLCVSSGEPRLFHRLVLFLQRLNCLILCCCSVGYLSIGHSLSWFRTCLSPSLSSWEKAISSSFQTWFFSRFLHSFFFLGSVFASLCLWRNHRCLCAGAVEITTVEYTYLISGDCRTTPIVILRLYYAASLFLEWYQG